jgi:U3 small nucleolar RNA-associated protein 10
MSQLTNQLKHLKEQFPSTQKTSKSNEKDSFLFTEKESAKIRSQDIHLLGLDGLNELIVMDNRFRKFKDELFDTNSLNFKRELQNNEVNEKLNEKLKNLLRLISPYFLLSSSHKVIEFLIRNYLYFHF